MSDANAKSSKTKTSLQKEVEKIKIVMGPFSAVLNDKEYTLNMSPEYAKDFSVEMMELAIPVGDYKKSLDKNGNVLARVDSKAGKKYVLNKQSNKIETKKIVKKEISEK